MNSNKDVGRINEYYNGMIEGVRLFSHWKDSEQFVGTCGTTLMNAIKDIEQEREQELKRAVGN